MNSISTTLRQDLPTLPARMRKLPVSSHGEPVPFFCRWVDGKPAMRAADPLKLAACHDRGLCVLCGEPLGQYKAFVLGPMSAVNRLSDAPPAHTECAKFAAMTSPDLALVWVTRRCSLVRTLGSDLFEIGEPEQTFWYIAGRNASRQEVMNWVQAGLPEMYEIARRQSETAVMELDTRVARAARVFPKHAAFADHA